MVLRTGKAPLKRQGTPSQLRGEMSDYVAEAESLSIERKGLVGDGGKLRTFAEEESSTQARSCLSQIMQLRSQCRHGALRYFPGKFDCKEAKATSLPKCPRREEVFPGRRDRAWR